MCGIVGAVAHTPVNQLLYDALLLLQHRGQDAARIVTSEGAMFHMHKAHGYVRDVFRTRNMRSLPGNITVEGLLSSAAAKQISAAANQRGRRCSSQHYRKQRRRSS